MKNYILPLVALSVLGAVSFSAGRVTAPPCHVTLDFTGHNVPGPMFVRMPGCAIELGGLTAAIQVEGKCEGVGIENGIFTGL